MVARAQDVWKFVVDRHRWETQKGAVLEDVRRDVQYDRIVHPHISAMVSGSCGKLMARRRASSPTHRPRRSLTCTPPTAQFRPPLAGFQARPLTSSASSLRPTPDRRWR